MWSSSQWFHLSIFTFSLLFFCSHEKVSWGRVTLNTQSCRLPSSSSTLFYFFLEHHVSFVERRIRTLSWERKKHRAGEQNYAFCCCFGMIWNCLYCIRDFSMASCGVLWNLEGSKKGYNLWCWVWKIPFWGHTWPKEKKDKIVKDFWDVYWKGFSF